MRALRGVGDVLRALRSHAAATASPPPILALTATAGRAGCSGIAEACALRPGPHERLIVRAKSLDRPELKYLTVDMNAEPKATVETAFAALRRAAILWRARDGATRGRGIIFVQTTKQADDGAAWLESWGETAFACVMPSAAAAALLSGMTLRPSLSLQGTTHRSRRTRARRASAGADWPVGGRRRARGS